ncbi:MAG: tandem-95 repeat protein, partial [Calditrichaeota bacterium]|nr:tandem-95 repeat protein [Calditrichota bacterium]
VNGFAALTLESVRRLSPAGVAELMVDPGGMLAVPVVFRPLEARDYAGTLTVLSNDPYNPEAQTGVVGSGELTPPDLTLSADGHDFGAIAFGERRAQAFTIGNQGMSDLVVESIRAEGDGFSVDREGESFTLEQGEELEFNAIFEPTLRGGYNGRVVIASNDPDREAYIELTGQGLAAVVQADPVEIDFGAIPTGSTGRTDLSISNIGDADLQITDITSDNEAFWAAVRPQHNLDNGWQYVETDENMRIVVEAATVNDEHLSDGDYIGIFTEGGICAGFVAAGDAPFAFEAWADDPATRDIIEGFRVGETMLFRFWVAGDQEEYEAQAEFVEGENAYAAGGEAHVNLTVEFELPQHDFSFRETDANHSLLVLEATLNGQALVADDEIGVFTPGGVCAGATRLEGNEPFPAGLAAWGAEGQTPGFRPGNAFAFRVWDASARIEANATPDYQEGPEVYEVNGFTALTLAAEGGWRARPMPAFDPPLIVRPNATTGVAVFFGPPADGEYEATLTIHSNDPANPAFGVALHGVGSHVNAGPEWVVEPEDREVGEGQQLSFEIVARDPEGDQLRMEMIDLNDALPEGVRFTDQGNGRATFGWTPGFSDAGEYAVEFRAIEQEFVLTRQIAITVLDVNRRPVWVSLPQRRVTGYVEQAITLQFVATDPDGEELQFTWDYIGEPPGDPDVETAQDGGNYTFTMRPDRFEAGVYNLRFTVTDGHEAVSEDFTIDVRADHFRFAVTGRVHQIRLESVEFALGNNRTHPDAGDELAVLTPQGLVAGAIRFDGQDRAPWSLNAYGDDPNTQAVDGFAADAAFAFRYYDHSAGVEYPALATFKAGDRGWRLNGLTLYEIFVGPRLVATPEALAFGSVRTGRQVERPLTLRNVGTTPALDVQLSIVGGDGFAVDDEGPFDIAAGQSIEPRIAFAPDQPGDYEAALRAANAVLSFDVALTGTGVRMEHYVYNLTNRGHLISVADADLDGEALAGRDEIGVFTPGGAVAGAAIVTGDAPYDLIAYGDDPGTQQVEGFRDNEALAFRIWDNSAGREFAARAEFITGTDRWQNGGFTVVTLSTGDRHWIPLRTNLIHRLTVVDVDYFGGELAGGDEIAAITRRNIVAGAVVVEGDGPWTFNAYGDDPNTPNVIEGFVPGSPIFFRIFRRADNREVQARAEWLAGPDLWENGAQSRAELTAARDNGAPNFRPVDPIVGREGQQIAFNVVASDPDGDPIGLLLTGVNLPPEARFVDRGEGVGTFDWTPTFVQAGEYTAQFRAFDGMAGADLQVRITVQNVNRAPALQAVGNRTIDEGQQLAIILRAADPDGDRIAFTMQNAPFGATLDSNLFRWTPEFNQAGDYEGVTFIATDFGQPAMEAREAITITVRNINRRPVWQATGDQSASESQLVQFDVRATDPDGDALRLSAEGVPEGAAFIDRGQGRGRFLWQTDFTSAGVYQLRFTAADWQLSDVLQVQLTIRNVNQPPTMVFIGNKQVNIPDTLTFLITAFDPDEGERERLQFSVFNAPPMLTLTGVGGGQARVVWAPRAEHRGVYSNVRFVVEGPSGGRDEQTITMTAVLFDANPPQIVDVVPAEGAVVRVNRPNVSARIFDRETFVDSIAFFFDNVRFQNFQYNAQSGEFLWQPEGTLSEGFHSYLIRAFDLADNPAQRAVRFEVNSTAGEIVMDEADPFGLAQRVNLAGSGEPFLQVRLIRNENLIAQTQANDRGRFRFPLVQLNESWNNFIVEGNDAVGNIATGDELRLYYDIRPPVITRLAPDELVNENQPGILAQIRDEGVGVDIDEGIDFTLDGEVIRDYQFAQGFLSYDPPEELAEGLHRFSLSAVDLLGNAPEAPYDFQFFIDTRAPMIAFEDEDMQNLFDDNIDSLQNRQPVITIPIVDPAPSSGIVWDEISLTINGDALELIINEEDGSISHDFSEDEPLEPGLYELVLTIPDRAGNVYEARGEFRIEDFEDLLGPFFANQFPPPNGIIGAGLGPGNNPNELVADTLRFVIGDNDAGIDPNSILIMVINPDGDTTIFRPGDFNFAPPGRVSAPLWYIRNDGERQRMPADIPGLEEGFNLINAFGGDNNGNENEEQWGFFFDATAPESPSLNQPENIYVNRAEVTVTGRSGTDGPDYGNRQNIPAIRIYRGGENILVQRIDYNSDFRASGVLLNEGRNLIRATVQDAAGNQSELSNEIEIFLDVTVPTVVGFTAEGGDVIADNTPLFSANLEDRGSGIAAEGITLSVNGDAIATEFNAETGEVTGTVETEMEDGNHVAILTVRDRAGNERSVEFRFTIDTRVVAAPEFDLVPLTSINRVELEGTGTQGTSVVVHLNGDPISLVRLANAPEFHFEYTAQDLPDTSVVRLASLTDAGVMGDLSEPQMLVNDDQPPLFSDLFPANGASVDVSQVRTVSVFIADALTGVDPNTLLFRLRGELHDFDFEEVDGGIRLTADISGDEFGDNEVVAVSASAQDHSIPVNRLRFTWEFVTYVGDPPTVTLPEVINIDEDDEYFISAREFIYDPDNGWAEIDIDAELLGADENAEMVLDENGFLRITPAEDWFGEFRLALRATDAGGLSGGDTTDVRVLTINDAPVITAIRDTIAIVGRDFRLQATATDADPGDELIFSDNSPLFNISADGLILFRPTIDQRGLYRNTRVFVQDQAGARDTTTFSILVTVANQPIEVVGLIEDVVVDEDADPFAIADLDEVFFDADGQPLTYGIEVDDEGLRIVLDQETGVMTGYLTRDFNGQVHVRVTADDRSGSTAEVEFDVTVNPVNDPPRLVGILPRQRVLDEDAGRVAIARLDSVFTDVDGDGITFDFDGGANLGVDIDNNTLLTIRTDDNWFGQQVFTVIAEDGVNGGQGRDRGPVRGLREASGPGWAGAAIDFGRGGDAPRRDEASRIDIAVEVRPVNDDPFRRVNDPHVVEMNEDEQDVVIEPSLAEMAGDVDIGDSLRVVFDNRNAPVALDYDNDRTHLVASAVVPDWNGVYNHALIFIDRAGRTVNLTLRIVVAPVNDDPRVVNRIGDQRFAEDSGPWDVADLDNVFTDVDGDQLQFRVVEVEGGGRLQANIDAQTHVLRLTADQHFNTFGMNPLTVTVEADDGQGNFAQAAIRIDPFAGGGWQRPVGPVRGLRDAEGAFFGMNVIQPRLDDDPPRRDEPFEHSFAVTITPVNDAPQWTDAPAQIAVDEGDLVQFDVTSDDVDLAIEGDQLTLSVADWDGLDQRGARFADNGDGTGRFTWQTDNADAGQYDVVLRVSDEAGRFDDVSVEILVGDINVAPVREQEIADQQMDEDEAERFIIDLSEVFRDPDGDALNFNVPDPVGLEARVNQGRLLIRPEANWNGSTTVVVIATDGRGGEARDTFAVAVRSINDLPTPFNLASPANNDRIADFPSIFFRWNRSDDVVEDSTMTYTLVLFFNGTRHYFAADDTVKRISRRELSINRNQPTTVRWWVYAKDGIDSIESNTRFNLTVEALSVREGDDLPLPTELALQPAYPNPFNDVVNVRFDLPRAGEVAVTVHDQSGRTVRTLTRATYDAGRYRLQWDGLSETGSRVGSGVYFCRLVSAQGVKMQRVVLLR